MEKIGDYFKKDDFCYGVSMGISSQLTEDGSKLEITVTDRFDFSQHKAFRDAYGSVSLDGLEIVIDLAQARAMDSSALGMLLVLRERAGGGRSNISLVGMNPNIASVLAVSRFEKLFQLR